MFEAARAGYPFTNLDKNVAIIDILRWRQKTAMNENRGSFTIDAALGGDGYLYHPHILFAQDGMTSDMLPETTKNWKWMSLSNNAFGVQTGSTFFPR